LKLSSRAFARQKNVTGELEINFPQGGYSESPWFDLEAQNGVGDSVMRVFHLRPKLTLRATSGLVAVAALLIWGGITASGLYRAAGHHRAQAATQDMYFKHSRGNQTGLEAEVLRLQEDIDRVTKNATKVDLKNQKHVLKRLQYQARFEARLADYHLQLKQKYEYAASHPWIKAAPDPNSPPRPKPEPELE
jgi:hypothetical protein